MALGQNGGIDLGIYLGILGSIEGSLASSSCSCLQLVMLDLSVLSVLYTLT